MLGRTLIACLPLLTLQVGFAQERAALGPGEVEGEITSSNPSVRSLVLGTSGYTRTSRAALFALTVPTGGVWTIRMESIDFDAYLVLRDAQGAVLAEDDDGWIVPDAQLQVELEADRLYQLDACALHEGGGAFTLQVFDLASDELTAEERLAAGLERMRATLDSHVRTLGPYHPATVGALEQLAWQLWWQGHYAEVVDLLRPLLAACEALRGPEHPDTARCLRHLADSLAQTGARAEAEAMHRRALAIREQTSGPRGAQTFDSLCALATHLMDEGRDEEAEVLIVRARELVRAAKPDELAGHDDGLLLVARHLRKEGRLEEAETLYRQSLGEALSGTSLSYAPGALLGLAHTLLDLGRADEAEPLFERARTAIIAQWGSRHRSLISAHMGLAELALQREQLALAHGHRLAAWELGWRISMSSSTGIGSLRGAALLLAVGFAWALPVATAHGSAPSRPAFGAGVAGAQDRGQRAFNGNSERALLEEAEAALARSDLHTARDKAAEALARLLKWPASEQSSEWVSLLDTAGIRAWLAQDPGTARRAFELVLEARSKTLPEIHPRIQRVRINLAAALIRTGNLAEARALLERVLEIQSRTLPKDHPELQSVRQNLAVVLKGLGEFEEARALEEQVLRVYSASYPEEHPALQGARLNLSRTLRELGDLTSARALDERVVEVLSGTLPADHPDLQRARLNLGVTLKAHGELHAARALYERVLEVRNRTLPEDHPDLQSVRHNLAAVIQELGDLQGARALQERVLATLSRTRPEGHSQLQQARRALARTYIQSGDHEEARMLLERSLELHLPLRSEDDPEILALQQLLAVAMKALGDLESARVLEEQVLETFSRTSLAGHPDLQTAKHNLAMTLWALGDLGAARALQEDVLESLSLELGGDHPRVQSSRVRLALTLAAQSEQASVLGIATDEEERERDHARCSELLDMTLRTGARLAREAIATSSRREAEERAAVAAERVGLGLSFAAGYGGLQPMPELGATLLSLSESTRGAALVSAELMRRAGGSERQSELRTAFRAASERLAGLARAGQDGDEFQAAVRERDDLERELLDSIRELLGAGAGVLEPDVAAFSRVLGEGAAALAYRRYARRTVSVVEGAAEQGLPAVAETLVDHLCAFVVRGGAHGDRQPLEIVDLGPIAPIEEAVSAWRAALGIAAGRGIGLPVTNASAEIEAAGKALRVRVFDPLLEALGEAHRIVLVLDDVLHLVPFDALPMPEPEDGIRLPLGADYRLELRATLTELLLPAREEARGGLVALGAADFDATPLDAPAAPLTLSAPAPPEDGLIAAAVSPRVGSGASFLRGSAWEPGFTPLAHTGREVRELAGQHAAVFGSSEVLLVEGARASRSSLLALAPRARWLHVATHGWYAPESIRSWQDPEPLDHLTGLGSRSSGEQNIRGSSPMLLAGLALAGANLPEDHSGRAPGLITAEELSGLDLSSCELAVLSACDTHIGVRRAGQGVASLQRALQMAGARSVITSLWKVPDEATAELMLDFYRRLWVEHKPKHQALWEAKLRLRNAKDDRGEFRYSVRDWGAWVLTGEPD